MHMMHARWIAYCLAALAVVAPGCVSPDVLRKAESRADVANRDLGLAKADIASLRSDLAALDARYQEAMKLIKSDPGMSAQVTLQAKLDELRLAQEQLAEARASIDKQREEIEQLESAAKAHSEASARNLELAVLRQNAVSYLKAEGYRIGYVKARVRHDFDSYVVLKLERSLAGHRLMIVEEGGLWGWNDMGHSDVFWFKDSMAGIEVIDDTGLIDKMSDAIRIDPMLESRIRQAAGG